MRVNDIPGLIANAMEFRDSFIPTIEEKKVMQKMFQYDDMEDFKPKSNKEGKDKYNRKALLIIVSYMMRLEESKDLVLKELKEKILKLSPSLIEMLLDTACEI